jgi:hypothetical protein
MDVYSRFPMLISQEPVADIFYYFYQTQDSIIQIDLIN